QGGLCAVAARPQFAAGPSRPQQPQRRGLPRAERSRGEEPRRRDAKGRCQCDPRCRDHGPQRYYTENRRRSRQFPRSCFCRRGRGMSRRSVIAGVGSALPKRQVSNEELSQTVDTTDEWIVERTGIRNRYIDGEGETTASLATEAA